MARQAGSGGPLSLYPEKAALAAGFRKTPQRPAPQWRVTATELLTVLRTVEVRGRYETVRRLRSTCGSVIRYAIATGRAPRHITVDLQGRSEERDVGKEWVMPVNTRWSTKY